MRLGGQDTDDDLTSSDEDGETTANQTMTPETRPAAHMLYEVDHVSPCPVSHYSSRLCKPLCLTIYVGPFHVSKDVFVGLIQCATVVSLTVSTIGV